MVRIVKRVVNTYYARIFLGKVGLCMVFIFQCFVIKFFYFCVGLPLKWNLLFYLEFVAF